MKNIITKLKKKISYKLSEIPNRYPYRINRILSYLNPHQGIRITFRHQTNKNVSQFNLCKISEVNVIDKFHPKEAYIIGFAACYELLAKQNALTEEGFSLCNKHISQFNNDYRSASNEVEK
ncbi:hypothetical protein [Facilibium subflavum]|uniref:hypothetical protein n=1 Tax=Facilibium subflavum TaxID=2219058 RepID=UPI000E64E774|nr:hypothetical protein [Facilibium subflavum]